MSNSHVFGDSSIIIRALTRADLAALAAFANTVPPHDLLFLARDIRQPKVLDAWLTNEEAGQIASLIALDDDGIVATVAALSDRYSWSSHVWDIRLLVGPAMRNKGLGRFLLERAIQAAISSGAARLTARMTPDQTGAITLFEECGFRAEALLRNQIRDVDGKLHDLAVLAMEPERETARRQAFGE